MSLDPMPSAAELRRIAQERGVLPPSGPLQPRSRKKRKSVRPWHPYRSKWEWEYAKVLAMQKATNRIWDWAYEPESLDIGIGAKYTPDFRVIRNVGWSPEYHEVKGYRREAAMVRLRVAAKLFTASTFVMVTKKAGQWHHEVIR